MAQSSLCHFPTNCLHWPLFTRFCQSKGPNNLNSTAKTLTIGFNSNAKKEGEGAECSVACSDLTPTSGTLVWESSDQLKHYLRWVGRRRRVIKTVPASQPKGYPSMCEGVYCDKDQLGWGRLTRIFKVQRHILGGIFLLLIINPINGALGGRGDPVDLNLNFCPDIFTWSY